MKALLANPKVRLALRALVAAVAAAAVQINSANGGTVAWRSVAVGAVLAFAEIFTPLNAIVGLLKKPA